MCCRRASTVLSGAPRSGIKTLAESIEKQHRVRYLHRPYSYHSTRRNMPRSKAPTAAVQPSKGLKISFRDDDSDEGGYDPGPSTRPRPAAPPSESDEESDDDEAPEAVGVSQRDDDDVSAAAQMLAQ